MALGQNSISKADYDAVCMSDGKDICNPTVAEKQMVKNMSKQLQNLSTNVSSDYYPSSSETRPAFIEGAHKLLGSIKNTSATSKDQGTQVLQGNIKDINGTVNKYRSVRRTYKSPNNKGGSIRIEASIGKARKDKTGGITIDNDDNPTTSTSFKVGVAAAKDFGIFSAGTEVSTKKVTSTDRRVADKSTIDVCASTMVADNIVASTCYGGVKRTINGKSSTEKGVSAKVYARKGNMRVQATVEPGGDGGKPRGSVGFVKNTPKNQFSVNMNASSGHNEGIAGFTHYWNNNVINPPTTPEEMALFKKQSNRSPNPNYHNVPDKYSKKTQQAINNQMQHNMAMPSSGGNTPSWTGEKKDMKNNMKNDPSSWFDKMANDK